MCFLNVKLFIFLFEDRIEDNFREILYIKFNKLINNDKIILIDFLYKLFKTIYHNFIIYNLYLY